MAKPSNLQLRAVLLTLLLAGGECARVENGVEFMNDADAIRQTAVAAHDASIKLGSGGAVCGDMSNPAAALQRYNAKRAKLLAVSDQVLEANCMASCPVKINEIKWRMKEFKSCTTALAEQASIPAELKAEMTSDSSDSLPATLMKVSIDLMTLLKKNNMFQEKDGCEFQPDGFTAEGLGDMDSVRQKIFGTSCGSEDKVNAYIESFPKSERNMLTNFMEKATKMSQTVQQAKESGDKTQELAELEAEMETAGSALLALDSDVSLQDAEGSGFAIIMLILIIVFWILFWCWIVSELEDAR